MRQDSAGNDSEEPQPPRDQVAEDEALAAAARASFRDGTTPRPEIDETTRGALDEGEGVVAIVDGSVADNRADGIGRRDGRLVVTTRRLIIVGSPATTIAALDELDDVMVTGGQLHAAVADGSTLTISTRHPRLFRVQLAEARARHTDDQVPVRPVEPVTDPSLR